MAISHKLFGCFLAFWLASAISVEDVVPCGIVPSNQVNYYIFGGVEAAPGAWPWMASILKYTPISGYLCGAVVIGRRYLLTAAHCVDDRSAFYTVTVGSHLLTEGDTYMVDTFYPHPMHEKESCYYDIALVKLRKDLAYTEKVLPICLPSSGSRYLTGQNVTALGWGAKTPAGGASKELRQVSLPVLPEDECFLSCMTDDLPPEVTSPFIYAGEGGKDTCWGDSGGPLMWSDNGIWSVEGIVSCGVEIGCAQPNAPGIYTRVFTYLPWITSIIEKDNCIECEDFN